MNSKAFYVDLPQQLNQSYVHVTYSRWQYNNINKWEWKTYRHRVEKYCHQYKQYNNYKESYNLASEAAPQNVPQAFKRWRKPPKGGRGSTVMWKQKCKILIYTVASSASVTWGVSMIIGSSNRDDGNDDAMIWLVQWEKKQSCGTH